MHNAKTKFKKLSLAVAEFCFHKQTSHSASSCYYIISGILALNAEEYNNTNQSRHAFFVRVQPSVPPNMHRNTTHRHTTHCHTTLDIQNSNIFHKSYRYQQICPFLSSDSTRYWFPCASPRLPLREAWRRCRSVASYHPIPPPPWHLGRAARQSCDEGIPDPGLSGQLRRHTRNP